MTGNPDCFAPMWEAGSKVDAMFSVINSAEGVKVSSRFSQGTKVYGVASLWRDSARWSCALVLGTPNPVPNGRVVLMKWISISTLNPKRIRKRGSEAIAGVLSVPDQYAVWRWSAGYVARDVGGDPRGRKSDAGVGAVNRRRPARAEGEKRFRSATRNP